MDIENKKCKNLFIIFILFFVLILSTLGSKSQSVKKFKREDDDQTSNENENHNRNDLPNKFSETIMYNNIDTLHNDRVTNSSHNYNDKFISEDYLMETQNSNHEHFILKKNSQMNNLNKHSEKISFANENDIYKNDNNINETYYYDYDQSNFLNENVNVIPNNYNFIGVKKKGNGNLENDSNYNKEMNEYESNKQNKENEKHNIEKYKNIQENEEELIDNNTILYNEKKEENIIDTISHIQNVENLKKNYNKIYDSNNMKENENIEIISEDKNSNSKHYYNKEINLDSLDKIHINNNIDNNISKSNINIDSNVNTIEESNNTKNISLNYISNNTENFHYDNENVFNNDNNDNFNNNTENKNNDNVNNDNNDDVSSNNNNNNNIVNNDNNDDVSSNNNNDNVNNDNNDDVSSNNNNNIVNNDNNDDMSSNNNNNNNINNLNSDNNDDVSSNNNNNNNIVNNNNNLHESIENQKKNIVLEDNSNITKNNSLKNDINIDNFDNFNGIVLNIYFTENINLYTKVKVGGQLLNLSLNSRLEGIYVFMKDSQACYKNNNEKNCYDPNISKKSTWCNNDLICLPPILTRPYECFSENNLNIQNKVEYPNIYYDSLKFSESHIEGSDDVELIDILSKNITNDNKELSLFENSNIKLVLDITFYKNWSLYKDTDGILGLAGKELGCRNASVWNIICEKNNLLFGIDINLPEKAIKKFVPKLNESIKKDISNYKNPLYKGLKVSKLKKELKNDLCKKGANYYQADPKHTSEKLADNKKNNNKNKYEKIQVTSNNKNTFIKKDDIANYDTKEIKEKANINRYVANSDIISYNSEIHIGDYKKNYGPIIWAEPRERGGIFSDSFMQFTIYNLEVCNKNIFGKYSSNWQGVIDLSSKCLVLPKMFWLSLMEYLPVNKNDERCIPKNKNVEFNENTIPRMCSVDEKNRPLPVLKFVFSDNDIVSDNNINNVESNLQEINIPLDNLIINDNKQDENYLCVIPDIQEGKSSENNGRTTKPLIKFGTYVLNNLYVVVDQDNYRVGFAHKKSYHYSNDKCTQKVECIGDQFYEPALNICVNPDCSIWYFYMLNDETKKCESLSPRFYFFIIILLTLLILDIHSYYFYRKSVHVAKVSSR
ncbi:conserved Plasmodium protein, unknown function [Plasmodium gallinaceum]|uniref:Peptidase n=1 Tax=Plasmodium gallinaceum TaxID=5849 RepID=A0A1J1GX99_PLAGA|nr:conserved Plasmodium protein, unknown function [Plasmodium gallinaceum]CRG97195.1 conserved Plasmodium protein, unknown function [Plasmodium gallinaceum]